MQRAKNGKAFGRLAAGALLAAVPTVVFLTPTIAGVSSWKCVLAVVSVVLFVRAERQPSNGRSRDGEHRGN
jgi:hypothetical protein